MIKVKSKPHVSDGGAVAQTGSDSKQIKAHPRKRLADGLKFNYNGRVKRGDFFDFKL